MNQADQEYLQGYNPSKYERPSVTVDVLIFHVDFTDGLGILMIHRDVSPFKGCWALPGGFVRMDESLDEAAERILKEETGLSGLKTEQLYTFGKVGRDPRTRVISVSYFALVHKDDVSFGTGRGNDKAEWKKVSLAAGNPADKVIIEDGEQIAFDHREIIGTGVQRLRGKISYTDLAFDLLKDKERFAIYELQKIYEAILGQKMDTANFRRMFLNTYAAKDLVEMTGEECLEYSRRASQYYRKK